LGLALDLLPVRWHPPPALTWAPAGETRR